jgi:hypothetical protein
MKVIIEIKFGIYIILLDYLKKKEKKKKKLILLDL